MSRYTVGNDIRRRRAERDWTQQQLAEMVGVSRQSIISIEQGRYVPSLALALQLAQAFGCSTDDLFRLEETGR
jgi:putative transcriptional regulator